MLVAALVSYLGSYSLQAQHVIGVGLGAALIFGISVAIYLAAYRLRLPGTRVRQLVEEASAPDRHQPA